MYPVLPLDSMAAAQAVMTLLGIVAACVHSLICLRAS